jgi:HEPN domain-containing protein
MNSINNAQANSLQQEQSLAALDDMLSGQLFKTLEEELMPEWFRAAISSDSSPYHTGTARGRLADFYMDLQILVEAIYVLYRNRFCSDGPFSTDNNPSHCSRILANEIKNGVLDQVEIDTIMTAISDFFDTYSLSTIKNHLWQWGEATISLRLQKAQYMPPEKVFLTFTKVWRLIETAFTFYTANKSSIRDFSDTNSDSAEIIRLFAGKHSSLYQTIVDFIVQICDPDRIYHLHFGAAWKNPSQLAINLLVVTPDTCAISFDTLRTQIINKFSNIATLIILFEKTDQFRQLVKTPHLFYSLLVGSAIEPYKKQILAIDLTQGVDITPVVKNAQAVFLNFSQHSIEYLEGARFYLSRENYKKAAFLLHQSAESILSGLFVSITGNDFSTHNICMLLQCCQSISYLLMKAFEPTSSIDRELLNLLSRGYIDTRYRPNYEINTEQVCLLFQKMELLQKLIAESFTDHVDRFILRFR